VGGDFIFTEASENGFIIAVIDCTGHGVPGAFMTMIAVFALGKIIRDEGHHDPAQILNRLNFLVKTILQQDTDYALSDDGLDAAICSVRGRSFVVTDTGDRTTDYQELIFAGAKLPLAYVYKNEITIIKGDKKSIGYKKSDLGFEFANHQLTIENGMSFYMFSDGFADQLGHEKERRFGTARFKELLRENAQLGFEKQRNVLLQAFNEYKGDTEVLDDVTVIGFRCK
jgi:serine phosphatase RsbU (regulator of sigma subunit)